jgi:hypothetical protein
MFRNMRRRLGWLAVGAHVLSAALVGGITYFSGGIVGYYFALFYLVSTAFRPVAAGYAYLTRRLSALGDEARYPRDDVLEARDVSSRSTGRSSAICANSFPISPTSSRPRRSCGSARRMSFVKICTRSAASSKCRSAV